MKHPETVKEFFYTLRKLRERTEILQRRSEYLTEKMQRGCCYTRAFVSGARDTSLQEQNLIALMDANEALRVSLREQMACQREAEALIRRLPMDALKIVLQDRYLCHRSWNDIAEELFFSTRHVQRLHGRALLLLQKPYEELIQSGEAGA